MNLKQQCQNFDVTLPPTHVPAGRREPRSTVHQLKRSPHLIRVMNRETKLNYARELGVQNPESLDSLSLTQALFQACK